MTADLPPLGGFSFDQAVLSWLHEHLPAGKTILELGSGNGTAHLVKRWDVVSVEHSPRFVGLHGSTYIHAPIVDGWYDTEVLRAQLPSEYDLIFVDGPPGSIGRDGFYTHFSLFRDDVPVVLDDTHRPQERQLVRLLAEHLECKPQVEHCTDGRTFAVLLPESG